MRFGVAPFLESQSLVPHIILRTSMLLQFSTTKTTALAVILAGVASATTLGFLWRRRRRQTAEANLWEIVSHSFTGALLHAGDQLHLYDLLWEQGPITADGLARQQGWSARWLQEFLAQAAAAGICAYNPVDDTFALRPEYAPLLCNPDNHRDSLAGMFEFLLPLMNRSDAVVHAIRTGRGVDFDWGTAVNTAIDRKNRNWFRHYMIDDVLAAVRVPSTGELVVDMLERGVHAADVGCGCGASTMTLAQRFPNSHFYAYESSQQSITVLQERIQAANVTNITVCDITKGQTIDKGPDRGKLGSNDNASFSFVYSHDVLHDMTHPQQFIQQVHSQLDETGCWIIVDVDTRERLEQNIRQLAAPLLYGFSCLLCLASATSTPDGQGLGTFGLSVSLLQSWTEEAGFSYLEARRIKSAPLSICYVVA